MTTIPLKYVSEETGCRYFHPYTCGKQVTLPCPKDCQRKKTFDGFYEMSTEVEDE